MAIFSASAFASDADNFPSYYAPVTGAPALCREGRTELVLEVKGNSVNRAWYTCRNGSFVPAAAPVVHQGCREGRTEIFIEYTNGGESAVRVQKTCRNGVYQ